MKFLSLVTAACLMLGYSGSSQAATMTFTITEVGTTVVIEASGSVDLTGLTPGTTPSAGPAIVPNSGDLRVGLPGQVDSYEIAGPLPIYGTGGFFLGTSTGSISTGSLVGFTPIGINQVLVPAGYVSLDPLSASTTYLTTIFTDASFNGFGITPGSYSFSFGQNDWKINIGDVPPVPLPAGGLLLLSGLVAFSQMKRRKTSG